MSELIDFTTRASERLASKADLQGGGGPPYGGDMEQRVTALEVKVDRLIGDVSELRVGVSDIKTTLARIEGKLDSKVDWKWALGITVAIILVMLRAEILALLSS